MNLKDLFVSHKQVEPVSFIKDTPELPKDIYLNLNRAQKATSTEPEPEPEPVTESPETTSETWTVQTKPSDYYTRLKNFIISEEGFRDKAYRDGKYYSIGYGFNDPKYKEGDTMTREQADVELDRQLRARESKYRQRFGEKWDNLSENKRIALMSYGYNTGDGNIINGDVARYLDAGDMTNLRDSLRINTFQGKVLDALENRRKRERTLFDS